MAKAKQQKLTLNQIQKQVNQYSKKQKVTLGDGNYVNIYPNFSPNTITKMIHETLTDHVRANDAGIDFESIKEDEWGFFNMIKFFSDLDIPSDIKEKVQVFTYLVESDYFVEIIQAFPQESIERVVAALQKTTESFNKLNAMSDEEREQFITLNKLNVENKVVQ